MDTDERVIAGAPSRGAAPARYAIAADLLSGRRVLDLGDPTGLGAEALRGACAELRAAQPDDPGWTDWLLAGELDAVVVLDGPAAPLRDPALLGRLVEVARADVGVLVALDPPDDGANGAHGAALDPSAVEAAMRDAAEPVLLEEHAVEGCLVRRVAFDAGTPASPLVHLDTTGRRPSALLLAVNLDAVEAAARLQVSAVPHATVARLEAAVAELERANRRLARERLGVAESAGASVLAKLDAANAEIARLRRELYPGEESEDESPEERAERERLAWIDGLIGEIDRHKELVAELEQRLGEMAVVEDGRAFALARRYVRLRARLGRRA